MNSQIPQDLKELIKIISLNFYGFEYYLIIEYLILYSCIREDDLAQLLKLDLKFVHQHLITLKKDKFLNEKLMIDIQKDGKHIKHSFFYINYVSAVNAIKYKLEKIRERIEKEKLESTKSFFRCVNCFKVYTEYDLREIFMTMTCNRCFGEVKEESQVYKNLMQLFNTKLSRVFELLKKVEKIQLPESVLRPVAHNEHLIHKKCVLGEQINYVRKEELETKSLEILKQPVSKIEPINDQEEIKKDLDSKILENLLKYEYKSIKIELGDQCVPSDELVDEKNFPTILVNGKSIRFDKITPELTNEMNEHEKETYITIIRDLYSQVYDNF